MASQQERPAYKIAADSHPVVGERREYLFRTGIEMSDLVRSTLGPNGMDKLLIDGDGMVIVSNQGSTILGEMHAESNINPAGEMFFTLADAQQHQLGDGATTGVVLAGELLREARDLIESGVHPTVIADGYQRAASESQRALERISTPVSAEDTERLESVVRTTLRGLGNQKCIDALPHLLVDAAVELHTVGESPRSLSVEKSVGGTVYDSVLMRGQVLLDNEPDMPSMPTELPDATVACVGPDVDHPADRDAEEPLDVTDASELDAIETYQDEALARLVARIEGCGVDAVFVSGSIADSVKAALSNADVLTVSQLTDESLGKVARSTGAPVLPALGEVGPGAVGHAGLVEQRVVGGVQAMAVQDAAETEALTLVLRGEIEHLVDEVERGVRTACTVLETVLETPSVLPGCGAPEIAVARRIREEATTIDSREQLVFEAYADAVETVPTELARSAGLDPVSALVDLRAAHADGNETTGVDAERGTLCDADAADILDVLAIKQQTYEAAAGTASRLLRIDELLPAAQLHDPMPSVDID